MPVSSRSRRLIGGPHVSETDTVTFGNVSFRVSLLYGFGDLLRSLSLDGQFGPKFVVRQNSFRDVWVRQIGARNLGSYAAIVRNSTGVNVGAPVKPLVAVKTLIVA